ncbi:MAG: metallophosphoesterase [Acidimicrobiales bacterium]
MHPDPTAFPPSPAELTTVATRTAVVFEAGVARRYDGLAPDADHELEGVAFRTLPERGELLCTFATVNDVHFGEEVCGLIDGSDVGPVFEVPDGAEPFPEVMNRAAIREIAALDPAALVVKGDLTSNGTDAEVDAFRAAYEPAFGDRLVVVRGNHESYHRNRFASEPFQEVELPGATLAVLDTSIDGGVHGPSPTSSSSSSTSWGPGRTARCWCSATTTWATPTPRRRPTAPSASTSRRRLASSRWWRAVRPSGAPSPATPTATGCGASAPPATCPGSRWRA